MMDGMLMQTHRKIMIGMMMFMCKQKVEAAWLAHVGSRQTP